LGSTAESFSCRSKVCAAVGSGGFTKWEVTCVLPPENLPYARQNGKRKAVVIIRERNGRSHPAVFRTDGQALSFIRSRITKGTIINADESR